MGTRLLSEHLIKDRYPHLRYVRIHTIANNTATIYAWNADLQLPDQDITSLKKFASGHLLQHVCYKVKSYDMVQVDQVPKVDELPEPIIQAAMSRDLNQDRIIGVMNELFTNNSMTFNRYDIITGTIHYEIHSSTLVTDIEKELIRQYLYEITPLGAFSAVTYCQEDYKENPTDCS